jgi:hypothetical protein
MLTVSQLSKSFAGRALFDDVSLRSIATIGFLPQETAFQVRETLSAFVGGNDEPVSIVAMHSNIAFDFVELKLDGVLHDG